jgi:hypothetical protein
MQRHQVSADHLLPWYRNQTLKPRRLLELISRTYVGQSNEQELTADHAPETDLNFDLYECFLLK